MPPKQLKLRSMFVASPGKILVSLDLSQAETWVVAHLANEPTMKHSLANSDIHRDTACFFDGCKPEEVVETSRYRAKKCNHALSYRMSYMRLAQVINQESDKPPFVVVSLPEARRLYEKWHTLYNLKNWWSQIEFDLNKNGRTLTTPYGRVRTFFGQWGQELFKEATAFVPQSTIADHLNGVVQPELGIEGGLFTIYEKFVRPGTISILNQGHDSIIAEMDKQIVGDITPHLIQLIKRPLVVNNETFTIPVDASVGDSWGNMEKWKQ